MQYKVYLNKKSIIITDNLNDPINFLFDSITSLDEVISRIIKGEFFDIFLYTPNIKSSWEKFKNHFDAIEAAGGLVVNDKNEYLFIFRNGIWDLPKGKMEKGESPEQTAIREVKEECGIKNIKIENFLFDTYHLFTENKKKRLKITHWYKMKECDKSTLIPQFEEGIEKVEWKDINKQPHILDNSYENIRLLFNL